MTRGLRWSYIGQPKKERKKATIRSSTAPANQKIDRIKEVIRTLSEAVPTGEVISGQRVEIFWPGAQLLTLNELLRIDHRKLTSYRHACHSVVREATWQLAKRTYGLKFEGQVKVTLHRLAPKLIDPDGLHASFKFMIDGFRLAGVLSDDDPLSIVDISHTQAIGKQCIGISISHLSEHK